MITHRKKQWRVGRKKAITRMEKAEQSDNPYAVLSLILKMILSTKWHLGYCSYYREANTGRYFWDTPQRDQG